MGSYFKSWRRKMGVMALLLACMFTGGWVRSLNVADQVHFTTVGGTWHQFSSELGEVQWESWSNYRWRRPSWDTQSFRGSPNNPTIDHEGNICFVRYSRLTSAGPGFRQDGVCVIAAYWSIVVPLALISAHLLLSNPRSKLQPPPPIQNGVSQ